MKKVLLSILVALPFAFVQSLLIAGESFPRTPSGKPDFSGNYDTSTLTPMNRPAEFGDREYYTLRKKLRQLVIAQQIVSLTGTKRLIPIVLHRRLALM